ncbi:putative peptidoglycan lipid II flippase [Streptomyces sp. SceaMP-e96]|uniref:murein biosynthesis integral membrane protein MurJ n=1 Tax=unclassified Streptomyces TaxID=2593676 RepID=UPI000823E22E|nr:MULTISPECIES: murein biosynthesis integral membrane protein MurJ [unclassified Streptomyces]MYT15831.1 murein biosynthesis integral membrane protein MurJ [Streptomyces sp. SID4951]SCK25079.1 putative peptidoglycan lipid II flippase [Streptomyces sp. SceaMP-e96]
MNAPYDGDRGRGANGDPTGPVPPTPPLPADQDPYVQDAYRNDPFRAQDPTAQDPVTEALYDRAAHPPPPGQPAPPHYQQPAAGRHTPDPQQWAPPPGPQAPAPHLPYGEDQATTQLLGLDHLMTRASNERPESDAFAHLYRDQQHYEPQQPAPVPPGPAAAGAEAVPQQPAPEPEPAPVAAAGKPSGGRASGLLKSSAVMAAGTMVSRLTGFVRSALIVAALGGAVLGDSWQVAYQLPTMIFILTIGGGLNSVFVPQLVRAMKEDDDGGEAYANRLLTLVMVVLGVLTVLSVVAAPLLVKLVSFDISRDPAANEVAVAFTRYCVPTIFFMGLHVVMGQILNARGRFGAMMWTPVLNNIVMIATFGLFIWVYGTAETSHIGVTTIPDEGIRLLGIGTLLGLVVQALAMTPYLRDADFKLRLRFDWRGHGLGKAAKLAKWTVLFVLANQAGVLVVTQLSTWAGNTANDQGHPGTGFISYASAQLIWNMPQAIITVSVMAALLPRLARSAHDGDTGAVRDDISQGLRTSAVAIVPISFGFLSLGIPLCTLVYGSSGAGIPMGYMLMAFGVGLIPFSVQYVVLRAFYAYEDTRTPFYNTVIVAAVNAVASGLCFLVLPARWAVVGMAASYGLAYIIGVGVAWRRLSKRMDGDLDTAHVVRTYARLAGASIPATIVSGAAVYGIMQTLGTGFLGSITALVAGIAALLAVFYVAARKMRIEELNALVGMVRSKLGR